MSAKDIRINPISKKEANACVSAWHYSGKPYIKSRLHMGVFYKGRLMGALQWGPSIDTRKMISIVPGTRWDGYLELNRMAMSDDLPAYSESRSIAVATRLIRKHAPHVEWLVSYSDATQCGDGAVYRAAGMNLTQVRKNTTLYRSPSGRILSDIGMRTSSSLRAIYGHSRKTFEAAGLSLLPGYQIRYIKFLTKRSRGVYTGKIMEYSDMPRDARMVRGILRQPDLAGGSIPSIQDVRPDPAAPSYIPHQQSISAQSWSEAMSALPDGDPRPAYARANGLSNLQMDMSF